MKWSQFTVYPEGGRNKCFPLQVLHGFLAEFIESNRDQIAVWHFLFEPSCLIRFVSDDPTTVLRSAVVLVHQYGLVYEPGDAAESSPSGASGVDFPGEDEFYGAELSQENISFLNACTGLSLELNKLPPKEFLRFARKHIHLFCNMLGMNYAEEAVFLNTCAGGAVECYEKYRSL